ncbi:MAG: DUF4340 domain-containing protein [Bacteroidota bacterium]
MKKNTLIILLILVLAGIVVFFALRKSNSSVKRELRDFAVEDTASIDKIFMVKKDLNQITLTRSGNHWLVNGKYLARPDAVENLLKTLNRVRIKSPVSKSQMDNAVKMLATRNTKVEVYNGRKLIKTLYVGGPTQDQMGTFMMIEGSSVPFVVHIPGFIGYLSTRFFVDEKGWRSTELFRYNFNDIAAITVENPAKPDESFRLECLGNNRFAIHSLSGRTIPGQLDTVGTKFFISQFEKMNFEFFADTIPEQTVGLMLSTPPTGIVTLEDRSGAKRQVKMWKRPAFGKEDSEGNLLEWDDERLWGLIDDKDWVVVQYHVFNPVFLRYDDFFVKRDWN